MSPQRLSIVNIKWYNEVFKSAKSGKKVSKFF